MAGVSFILGIIGNVTAILMFLSPIKTFRQVVKKKSTENFKGLPYMTTLLTTSLWTFYGLLKPGALLVVTVNGTGAALHILYVLLFLLYAPKNIKVSSLKLVAALNVGFPGAVVIVTLLAFKAGIRLTIVGIICAGVTIGMYAAPLSAMRIVIKTKSVKYMPFFLSFFQFLNGGAWSTYAVLVTDYYIGVSNGIGFLLGSAQLILYAIYQSKSISEESEEKMQEEGAFHFFQESIQMQDFDQDEDSKMKNRSLN